MALSGAFPVNSEVCFYKEFIFPPGQMHPCPFSDMALGLQWSAGSSQWLLPRHWRRHGGRRHLSSVEGFHCFRCLPTRALEGWSPSSPSYSFATAA